MRDVWVPEPGHCARFQHDPGNDLVASAWIDGAIRFQQFDRDRNVQREVLTGVDDIEATFGNSAVYAILAVEHRAVQPKCVDRGVVHVQQSSGNLRTDPVWLITFHWAAPAKL